MSAEGPILSIAQESLGMEIIGEADPGLGKDSRAFALHSAPLMAWSEAKQPADLLIFSSSSYSASYPMVVTSEGEATPVDMKGIRTGR